MQSAAARKIDDASASLLQAAFKQFTDVSSRLEKRYEALATETEQLRAQLRAKEEEVKRAERLSMLGETAAALAHEVRNPLGAIKLFISLLRQDVSDRPEALSYLQAIDTSINSLDHVVTNILQFSRGQKLDMAPLNIHAVLEELVAQFRVMPDMKGEIRLQLEARPFISGNAGALRQVFHNLLLNALQATKQKGCVEVHTCEGPEGDLLVSVRDNGPGIPADMLERLFDPFVTGRNEGTGLGLAIVRRIIGQHGGEIQATNEGGAKFNLRLPRRS